MDANGSRRILAFYNFGTLCSDIRKGFADVVQKVCTDLVQTHTIEALLSYRFDTIRQKSRTSTHWYRGSFTKNCQ